MKGLTLTQLLQQQPGSIPLTHRALRYVQKITRARRRLQHGVARSEIIKFADGMFCVTQYWVITQSGSMTHSYLYLRALTLTGGLRHLDRPAEVVAK